MLRERVRLHIFGEGPERANLAQPHSSVTDREVVTLHRRCPAPQTPATDRPDRPLRRRKGSARADAKGWPRGVPVIGTDVRIRDVVQHEVNGLLVPVGNGFADRRNRAPVHDRDVRDR